MATTVDVHTLAEFWGVDVRTIQNYADASYETPPLPRVAKGEYDFVKAMKWMYQRQKHRLEIAENSGDEKLHALKMRGQTIKNQRDFLALRKELGQLVDKKEMLIAITNVFYYISSSFESLKYDLTQIQDIDTEQERIEALDKLFNEFQDKLQSYNIQEAIESKEFSIVDIKDNIAEETENND